MATKTFLLAEDLTISIHKRRGNRNMRLSISPKGDVKLTMPVWAPYAAGLQFARSRQDWIKAHLPAAATALESGMVIGRGHYLELIADNAAVAAKSRVHEQRIVIHYPASWTYTDKRVQQAAEAAAIRALRKQATVILPPRLRDLSAEIGLNFRDVNVKLLKSRWGSCDSHKDIVLNLFLMQLPDPLIDYVLVHELAHTQVLGHGPAFWELMQQHLPDFKERRKQLRGEQPVLRGLTPDSVA